jgi:hypothetical protein
MSDIQEIPDPIQTGATMLRCTMCGHTVRCCHVLCPVCGERMVQLEEYEQEVALASQVGTPLFPEDIKTQCKICGQRSHLYLVTDYKVGDDLTLGVCKDCYFENDG